MAAAHGPGIDPGPLGVGGFPDCRRKHPELDLTMEEAALDLECAQKADGAIKVGWRRAATVGSAVLQDTP